VRDTTTGRKGASQRCGPERILQDSPIKAYRSNKRRPRRSIPCHSMLDTFNHTIDGCLEHSGLLTVTSAGAPDGVYGSLRSIRLTWIYLGITPYQSGRARDPAEMTPPKEDHSMHQMNGPTTTPKEAIIPWNPPFGILTGCNPEDHTRPVDDPACP